VNGDARERLTRRLAERMTREILARETVLDSGAIFNQILFVVTFRRENGTIKGVKVRYHDDGED